MLCSLSQSFLGIVGGSKRSWYYCSSRWGKGKRNQYAMDNRIKQYNNLYIVIPRRLVRNCTNLLLQNIPIVNYCSSGPALRLCYHLLWKGQKLER